ncbi:alpha/beta fold hydrolase [Actinophytocola oryzae]|uniref:Alpha/beta hydrolase family protein n=1 Tax=Actinophytocola oryzae TaxID=502181 RepID=A0A4R7V5U6_9PSEU|nr:alpha/beta fold hydrolase [Actinophytocola oryzae]TDV44843.1 alpha/beta hydrolase family protein [Actinophytocola oryzae]
MRFEDHTFDVPLDHDRPDGERITLYAREVTADDSLPWLLFLNGGPGFPSPRPLGDEGWLRRASREYRVLLLDQRGTGRSTPVTRRVALARGASYLTYFRADSIVRDAEMIRAALRSPPWTVLGQSFGGFCTVTYLSFFGDGLRSALVTGGLPGLTTDAADVYRSLYPVVAAKNEAHYVAYPEDVVMARRVAAHLASTDVRLPNGRLLSVAAFQSVGTLLGGRDGHAKLHYLLESPFDGDQLSDAFLLATQEALSWSSAASPLYYLLHEPSYAQGFGATSWAAQRVRAEFPAFDAHRSLAGDDPVLFTGEMIYPWMFDDDPLMAPLRPVADELAERIEWPPLYDVNRLGANRVPVAAAVYDTDLYVSRDLSLRTAAAIGDLRLWHTADHQHDGLRVSDGEVLSHLLTLLA